MHWFTRSWWRYLYAPITHKQKMCNFWWFINVPLCRAKGHPNGVIWYNSGGLEPNMHCRDCYDDLG